MVVVVERDIVVALVSMVVMVEGDIVAKEESAGLQHANMVVAVGGDIVVAKKEKARL